MSKTNHTSYLQYALNANGKLVHIDNVPNGANCGCVCPNCKAELNAKNKGHIKVHHFAHISGSDCGGSVESVIHLLAKEVLCESKELQLPDELEQEKRGVLFDRVDVEVYYPELQLKPDCVGYYGDTQIWIEFKHTHKVDATKQGKVFSAKINCVEIDLNDCEQDKDKIRKFLLESCNNRVWIYHPNLQYTDPRQRGIIEQWNNSNGGYIYQYYGYKFFAYEKRNESSQQQLICICDGKVDAINNKYYCPGCGEELFVNVETDRILVFKHRYDTINCNDDMYMKKTAQAIVCSTFIDTEKFEIKPPIKKYCYRKCKLFEEEQCSRPGEKHFDLKKLNFCNAIPLKSSDNESTNVLLQREPGKQGSIVLQFYTDSDDLKSETQIASKYIQIHLRHHGQLFTINKGLIDVYSNYLGFDVVGKQKTKETISPNELYRTIPIFILKKNGSYFINKFACTENIPKNATKEFAFKSLGKDRFVSETYAILQCYKQGLRINSCRLCRFLKMSNGAIERLICIRYKTVGTPRNPLVNKQATIGCKYFQLDQEKVKEAENSGCEIVEI